MRWLTIVVAVLGLALVGAGCGGGEDEASDDTGVTITTEATETTDTTETDAAETTEDMDTDAGTVGGVTEDCLAAVTAFAALSQAVGAAGAGGDTGAGDSAETFGEFADRAPEEIQDDIRVLADAYRAYIQELRDLDLQVGETPSTEQIQQLTEASAKLNTAEVTAASESFNTWASTNCPG